jgi:hypothetical protein
MVPGVGAPSIACNELKFCFFSGIIYTVFGGAFINLRSAELDEKGAILDLFSTFGGITIRLPKSWTIEVRTNTVLGGIGKNVYSSFTIS